MKKICGIYRIDSLSNGRFYIGQSVDYARRKDHHLRALKLGIHKNRFLQRAWNKYGENSFKFSIILLCERVELTRYEQGFVDILNPEYNLYKICVKSAAGHHLSEETKRKLSACMKGRVMSEETRRKIALKSKIHRHSEETKKKLSELGRGKKLSEEVKRKIGLKSLGNHYALGHIHSPETRKIMSEFQKSQIKSPEHCKKDSEALKKWWSEHKETDHRRRYISKERRQKLSEYNKNRKGIFHHSPETKKKMSESQKRRFAREEESVPS